MENNVTNTCCFIGHRKIKVDNVFCVKLKNLIVELIDKGVNRFLFGSRSEFDSLCLKIVSDLKEKYPFITRVAYTCKSEGCVLESKKELTKEIYSKFLKDYVNANKILCVDEEFEHKTKYTADRSSYVERNFAMINDSDFCIFYYDKNYLLEGKVGYGKSTNSGTRIAYNYALSKKNKIILNTFNLL